MSTGQQALTGQLTFGSSNLNQRIDDPQRWQRRIRRRQEAFVDRIEQLKREQRARALEGGTRYTHPSNHTPDYSSQQIDETICQNCGEDVPSHLRRGLGDNDDVLWGCLNCYNFTELKGGAGKSADCHGTLEDRIQGGFAGSASNVRSGMTL